MSTNTWLLVGVILALVVALILTNMPNISGWRLRMKLDRKCARSRNAGKSFCDGLGFKPPPPGTLGPGGTSGGKQPFIPPVVPPRRPYVARRAM